MAAADIDSDDLVSFARQILDRPEVGSAATVGNYMSHLSAVFSISKPLGIAPRGWC